jgi:hypothetical protein
MARISSCSTEGFATSTTPFSSLTMRTAASAHGSEKRDLGTVVGEREPDRHHAVRHAVQVLADGGAGDVESGGEIRDGRVAGDEDRSADASHPILVTRGRRRPA